MISREKVKRIAELARIGLAEKEIGRFQKELSKILDYIEKLKEVDISEIAPSSHPFEVENIIREDEERKEEKNKSKKLLALAPENKEGYLKVKSVF